MLPSSPSMPISPSNQNKKSKIPSPCPQLPFTNLKMDYILLELVHSNICDPIHVPSLGGAQYILMFTEHKSWYPYYFYLEHKDSTIVSLALRNIRLGLRTRQIRRLRSCVQTVAVNMLMRHSCPTCGRTALNTKRALDIYYNKIVLLSA